MAVAAKEALSNAQDMESIMLEAEAVTGGDVTHDVKERKKFIRFLRAFWFEKGLCELFIFDF